MDDERRRRLFLDSSGADQRLSCALSPPGFSLPTDGAPPASREAPRPTRPRPPRRSSRRVRRSVWRAAAGSRQARAPSRGGRAAPAPARPRPLRDGANPPLAGWPCPLRPDSRVRPSPGGFPAPGLPRWRGPGVPPDGRRRQPPSPSRPGRQALAPRRRHSLSGSPPLRTPAYPGFKSWVRHWISESCSSRTVSGVERKGAASSSVEANLRAAAAGVGDMPAAEGSKGFNARRDPLQPW
uniref:Uncharacterized protein n=1 Tax=Oryza rufipogon TaxID=4529 RepID=A0A0E0R624_ORYRU